VVVETLKPYGIIQRDFQATYEQAAEKRWNEIVDMLGKQSEEAVVRDYLLQLACNVGSAAFITPALIRSERIMTAFGEDPGDGAKEVIELLKKPSDQCPAAQSLQPSLKVLLNDMENRIKSRPRTAETNTVPVKSAGRQLPAWRQTRE
jgi:hypothetical protein